MIKCVKKQAFWVNSCLNIDMFKIKREYLIVVIILLVGLASFGLGRISVLEKNQENDEVEFIIPELSKIDTSFKGFGYLASINGTKYYPRGCGSANRISVKNRIYFKSGIDAEKSGFERTKTC